MSQYIPSGTSARMRVSKPDDMQMTFELTMSLGDWKRMAADLKDGEGDAINRLQRMIGEMVGGAVDAVGQTYSTTGWSGFRPDSSDKAEG